MQLAGFSLTDGAVLQVGSDHFGNRELQQVTDRYNDKLGPNSVYVLKLFLV
jgi:hypothetical protein